MLLNNKNIVPYIEINCQDNLINTFLFKFNTIKTSGVVCNDK